MGKKIMFHGTFVDNVESIKEKGLESRFEGVYLTSTPDSAARWTGFKAMAMQQDEIAIICVTVDEDLLVPGTDHSPLMQQYFGVGDSVVHTEPIPADQILNVLYYTIGKK